MFQEGDIVEIPLPDGRAAIGWILHISQRFKNAVGFVVCGIKGEKREDVNFDPITGDPASMKIFGPLYTHIDNLTLSDWKIFAHQPLSNATRILTKREVGGNVYVGDECLGTVEELGEYDLKPMLGMGMPAVYKEIEKAFGRAA